jgi:hypothetical protein
MVKVVTSGQACILVKVVAVGLGEGLLGVLHSELPSAEVLQRLQLSTPTVNFTSYPGLDTVIISCNSAY